jgi:type 1 fimbriae regulatory protein FimB/type 1 fimbriae regulatory protein FimE
MAARSSGYRDACMILLAFRHGLRVSELIALRWNMVDLDACLLHVTRLKHAGASSHPLRGPEVRGLRRVKRDAPQSPYVFVSEREAPMTDSNFRKMLARASRAAGFDFLVHPHMLRHATGLSW